MPVNNRGQVGQPVLPYIDYRGYAGVDVFVDLAFLDYTGTLQVPTSASYQLDDISNSMGMIPSTAFTPGASTYTLQIPGSKLAMSYNFQGSQLCQLIVTAILPGGATVKSVTIIELCAIQTPGGQ